ncbi:hypothetical protein [Hymenobacter sp.]|uniref:hypothetical protein n=1 Tax=Hymenobacter sp. TaxID=1898978 RepID=UPI00286CC07D|nr:hypothetical protein [Hymenobacter sp.]
MDVFQWILGAAVAVIAFFLRSFYEEVRELRAKQIEEQVKLANAQQSIADMKANWKNDIAQLEAKIDVKLQYINDSLRRIEALFLAEHNRPRST